MHTGWFDSLHPLTKLTWAFSLAVHVYMATTFPASMLCWGLAVLTPLTAADPRAIYRTLWGIFIPVGISLFLLQGVFFPSDTTQLWHIGGVSISVSGMSDCRYRAHAHHDAGQWVIVCRPDHATGPPHPSTCRARVAAEHRVYFADGAPNHP